MLFAGWATHFLTLDFLGAIFFWYLSLRKIFRRKQKFCWVQICSICCQKISLKFFATFPPIPRHADSLKISEDSRKTSSVVIRFAFVYPCVSTEDPEEQKCFFILSLSILFLKYKKVFRVFRNITDTHTIKPKHGWRLLREGLQILHFSLQGLQEHKQEIEHIWIEQNFCFLLNIFFRLKYQKNMAPKKSKVKKFKVKKCVAQPAKSIIERTICAHPMLKRVQKEVRELKKKSAKKHKK